MNISESSFCIRSQIILHAHIIDLLTVVWNIKSQQQRFVDLIPNDDWGGTGLLGVTIRLDNYGGAEERLIRVLEVQDKSPAAVAGLVPMKDFLLGTTVTAFASTQILASVLEQHINQVVEIYVYNSDSDVVRVVGLMPTLSWGGRGLLGAEVGTGYLHRLPSACRSTTGQSVERKLRWMNRSSDNKEDGGGSGDFSSIPPQEPAKEQHGQASMLEMEPHLEMEVESDKDNRPEDVTKQPHELGNSQQSTLLPAQLQPSMTDTSSKSDAAPARQSMRTSESDRNHEPPKINSPPAESALIGSVATQKGGQQSLLKSHCEGLIPPSTQIPHTEDDAEALFSGPPPPTSSKLSVTTTSIKGTHTTVETMPSPPKMTY